MSKSFRSNNFNFTPTAMSAAFNRAGRSGMHMRREPKVLLNKGGEQRVLHVG